MPRHSSEEITLAASSAPVAFACAGLQAAFHRLYDLARRGHLPPGLHHAALVAEPAGRAAWRSLPAVSSLAPRPPQTGVVILTANLWHDFPRCRTQEARLERFAGLVEQAGADILLLQEVSRRPGLQVDAWLAERLGMAYVYARANGHADAGFEEGLAVFSRYPLADARLRLLGSGCSPFVRRLALGASIQTPSGPLLVFSVHLALVRRQNWQQLLSLCDWLDQLPAEAALVVGGDFNAPEHSAQIHHARTRWTDTFRHQHPHREIFTHEVRWPWGKAWLSHRLDYIFLRPGVPAWQILAAHLLETPGGAHSDHLSMLAQIAPAPASQPTIPV